MTHSVPYILCIPVLLVLLLFACGEAGGGDQQQDSPYVYVAGMYSSVFGVSNNNYFVGDSLSATLYRVNPTNLEHEQALGSAVDNDGSFNFSGIPKGISAELDVNGGDTWCSIRINVTVESNNLGGIYVPMFKNSEVAAYLCVTNPTWSLTILGFDSPISSSSVLTIDPPPDYPVVYYGINTLVFPPEIYTNSTGSNASYAMLIYNVTDQPIPVSVSAFSRYPGRTFRVLALPSKANQDLTNTPFQASAVYLH